MKDVNFYEKYITPVKIGNRILYNIDSIKKWLNNIEQK